MIDYDAQINAAKAEAAAARATSSDVQNKVDALDSYVRGEMKALSQKADKLANGAVQQGVTQLTQIKAGVDKANNSLEQVKGGIQRMQDAIASLRTKLEELAHIVKVEMIKRFERLETRTDARYGLLHKTITRLFLHVMGVRNPQTGQLARATHSDNDLWQHHRKAPLTAEGFEALELPAAAYDAQSITALVYDDKGGEAAIGWDDMDALTAAEYEALQLTAQRYAAFGVTAWFYDQAGKTMLAA